MKQYPAKETVYYDNFRDFLNDAALRYGESPAVTCYNRKGEAHTRNYRQLKEDAFAFGEALCGAGLSGKHAALISENSQEWLTAWFGVAASGGVTVCIDIEHRDETIIAMAAQADAEILIVSPSMLFLGRRIVAENSNIKKLLVTGSDPDGQFEAMAQFTQRLLEEGSGREAMKLCRPKKEQTATIVYTSGTTSTAKPVMLSQHGILRNAGDSLTLLDSGKKVFNTLPLYHTYGFTCGVLCALIRGIEVGLSCDLKRMIQEMTYFKPNTVVAVPLIIEAIHKLAWSYIKNSCSGDAADRLMKLENFLGRPTRLMKEKVKKAFADTCLKDLEYILSGGAHLSEKVAQDLEHFGIVVLQGYGITECSPSISVNRNEDYRLDSVGLVLPSYEVRIVDDEIQVRGVPLMNGYYKQPELTAQSYDGEWFKTGDLGYLDKQGHVHITGRKKNLIVMKNGKKVAVEEMEEEMKKLPLVKEAMVYGAKSGISEDDVKIAVMVYPDQEAAKDMTSYEILEQLQEYVDRLNAQLPTYKQIQMVNIRDTEFERTSSNKIKRQLV